MLEALLAGVSDPGPRRPRQGPDALEDPAAAGSAREPLPIEHHGVMVAQLLAISTRSTPRCRTWTSGSRSASSRTPTSSGCCARSRASRRTAQVLIPECGLDMTMFPTVGHLASWAGLPGHHESAGRRRSGRTRPGPRWLTDQLTECAKAAAHQGTYLAAHYAQLRGRRGEAKAIGAIRHDLLVAYYHIVRDQVPYPRTRTRLATQALLRRTPRPPPPAPTRSARLHRHPRANDQTQNKPPDLHDSRPGLPPTQRRRERPCPNAVANSGIHRTAPLSRALAGGARAVQTFSLR